jgi:hypothetical protein
MKFMNIRGVQILNFYSTVNIICARKTNRLRLFRGIIGNYCDNPIKPSHIQCEQNDQFYNVKVYDVHSTVTIKITAAEVIRFLLS